MTNISGVTLPEEDTKQVVFPYETWSAAVKDKFSQIGGPEAAFRFLKKGYKDIIWRKRAELATKLREAAEDDAFRAQQAREGRRVKK